MKKIMIIFFMIQNVVFAGVVSTSTDKLNLRIHHQTAQIQKETKLGKLTKDQAKSLKSQVEAIRKQELVFLKQDNAKTLTDAQVVQLNGQLDSLSKSIPIK